MAAGSQDTSNFTEILYKYIDHSGAQKILSTRTLRFSRASEMNDPFDVYIADPFGIDLDEFFQEAYDAFFNTLLTNPEHFAAVTGADPTNTIEWSRRLRSLPDAERLGRRELLQKMGESDPVNQEVRATLERQRDELAARVQRHGIFAPQKHIPTS